MKKTLFGILALLAVLNTTGCGKDKKDNKKVETDSNITSNVDSNTTSNDDSNITSNDISNSNTTSNVTSNTTSNTTNSKYIKMEVSDMSTGKVTTYEVDNYARGVGAAGMSNLYYYVKDNTLYSVTAADPKSSTKVATGVRYVYWDMDEAFVAIADETKKEFKQPSYLKYADASYEKEITVTHMTTLKEYKIAVDCSAQPFGGAGMGNTTYFLKNNDLYLVDAADPTVQDKIATGVKYIGFNAQAGLIVIPDKNYKAIAIPNNGYIHVIK